MDDNWIRSRAINKYRVSAPRRDITVNLLCYQIKILMFKVGRIEKSGAWLRGFSGKLFQWPFFEIWGVTQGNFWKTFPKYKIWRQNWNFRNSGHDSGDFLENFSRQYFGDFFTFSIYFYKQRQKNRCTGISMMRTASGGHGQGRADTDSVGRYVIFITSQQNIDWKSFPENPLTHAPILNKKNYSWLGSQEIQLEKFSRNSPQSRPEISKSEKSLEKFSKKSPESRPVFWKSFPGFPDKG